MTSGIRTSGLILDRSNDAKNTFASGPIHSKAIRTIETGQRFGSFMAAVTRLPCFIDQRSHFGRRRRIADLPLRIHDSYPYHAGLVGHVQHHFVKANAVVVQHVMRGAAAQNFALLLGRNQRCVFQMFSLILNAEIAEQSEDDDQDEKNTDHQLDAYAARQAVKPSRRQQAIPVTVSGGRAIVIFSHPHGQAPRFLRSEALQVGEPSECEPSPRGR